MATDPAEMAWKLCIRTLEGKKEYFQATRSWMDNALKDPTAVMQITLPGKTRPSLIRFCLRGEKNAYFREVGLAEAAAICPQCRHALRMCICGADMPPTG